MKVLIIVILLLLIGFTIFRYTQMLENTDPFGNVWKHKNSRGETYGYRASNMLRDSQSVLQELGIPMLPMYGTLLGLSRNDGLIPWDDDIDVCVPKEDFKRILNNKDRFSEHGIGIFHYGPIIKLYDLNEKMIQKSFGTHNWSWPFIDIFGYVIKDDMVIVDDVEILTPTHAFKVNDVFPTIIKHFEGIPMRTPVNFEKVLDGLYGENWKTECVSSPWNHRKEKSYSKTYKKKCLELTIANTTN